MLAHIKALSFSTKVELGFVEVMSEAQPADVVFEAPGCG